MEKRYLIQFIDQANTITPLVAENAMIAEDYVRNFVQETKEKHNYYTDYCRGCVLGAEIIYPSGDVVKVEILEAVYLTERAD